MMMAQSMIAWSHMAVAQFNDIKKKQRPCEPPWGGWCVFVCFYLGQGDPVPSFIHTVHSTQKPDFSAGLLFYIYTLLYRKCTFFKPSME